MDGIPGGVEAVPMPLLGSGLLSLAALLLLAAILLTMQRRRKG